VATPSDVSPPTPIPLPPAPVKTPSLPTPSPQPVAAPPTLPLPDGGSPPTPSGVDGPTPPPSDGTPAGSGGGLDGSGVVVGGGGGGGSNDNKGGDGGTAGWLQWVALPGVGLVAAAILAAIVKISRSSLRARDSRLRSGRGTNASLSNDGGCESESESDDDGNANELGEERPATPPPVARGGREPAATGGADTPGAGEPATEADGDAEAEAEEDERERRRSDRERRSTGLHPPMALPSDGKWSPAAWLAARAHEHVVEVGAAGGAAEAVRLRERCDELLAWSNRRGKQ